MTYELELEVDRLFREAPDRDEKTHRNPVTGTGFTDDDPIGPQKRAAIRALTARAWFARENPGMPPLPVSYAEREEYRGRGGVHYIVSVYARSLEAQNYDLAGIRRSGGTLVACLLPPTLLTSSRKTRSCDDVSRHVRSTVS